MPREPEDVAVTMQGLVLSKLAGTWTISVGDSGEAWAKALGKLVAGLGADDLVICLISGGGSALLPLLHLAQSVDGYLTDAGMCGPEESILGRNIESVVMKSLQEM